MASFKDIPTQNESIISNQPKSQICAKNDIQ